MTTIPDKAAHASRARHSTHRSAPRTTSALRWFALCGVLAISACSDGSKAPPPPNDFMRLNADGAPYVGNGDFATQPWSCVADRYYGLTWEMKSAIPGLQDRANTYTWYNPDKMENYGAAGTANGGKCSGSDCDVLAYAAAVNVQGYCGARDWRVPSKEELATLNDPRITHPGPTIDPRFFPDTQSAQYWSGTAYAAHYAGAWAYSFDYGYDRVDWKKTPKYLRLVRGKLANRAKDPDD